MLVVPFSAVTIWWITLMWAMKATTGELKHWLTPNNTLKSVAIIFITIGTLALAVLGILEGSLVATIFSGIIGYTLGTTFDKNN
ncbi:MAG TPA: hypothetical protein DEA89_01165 [Candidatus Moranbacteria bacterium]|nr:hypothetical protein [Candidatus Moranbacteria bacterium]HBU10518.1 hypothetical protein [Candidatus Moranbacteria bacterium]HCO99626.1 hypothetical protein [Candidatus Moranbacteria bacterium]